MQKQFTFIQGASGEGKTLYARHMALARKATPGGRVVVVDPNAVFGESYGSVGNVRESLARIRAAGNGALAVVVRPGWGEKMEPLWKGVFAAGRLLLVVDEAKRWAAPSSPDPDFLELQAVARNRFVDIATTSQGPKTLHPDMRGNWDVVVTFRQAVRANAEYIAREYFGRPELAEAITRLPKRNYLRATQGGELSRGVVSII